MLHTLIWGVFVAELAMLMEECVVFRCSKMNAEHTELYIGRTLFIHISTLSRLKILNNN